jgi:hypothetical protein
MTMTAASNESHRVQHTNGTTELSWACVTDTPVAVSFTVRTYTPADHLAPPDAVTPDGKGVLLGAPSALIVHYPASPALGCGPCLWLRHCHSSPFPTPSTDRKVLAAWAAAGFVDEAVWAALWRLHADMSAGGVS